MILQFLLIVEKETLTCSMRSTCNKKQAIAIHKVSQLQITMFNVHAMLKMSTMPDVKH